MRLLVGFEAGNILGSALTGGSVAAALSGVLRHGVLMGRLLDSTWIGATGQKWKIHVSTGLMIVGLASFGFGIAFSARSARIFFGGMFGGMVLGVVWLIWNFLAIYCPYCKSRLLWHTFRRFRWNESIAFTVLELNNCPKCGHSFIPTDRLGPLKPAARS